MFDTVLDGIAVFFFVVAVVAPCVEAVSEHRWPRITLLPSCVAMILALLLYSAVE